MSREIVQLHTIEQWQRQDPLIRSIILQNIKLRDRLYTFLEKKNVKKSEEDEPRYVKCNKCYDSQYPGHILLEPRYAGLHPSQIGHPCLLKIVNEMKGITGVQRIEPRLRLIFDIGHAAHAMFQGYGLAGAWGSYYKPEAPINCSTHEIAKDLMIEGHADADNILVIDDIPVSPIYEVGIVHEYKTINDNGFKSLTGAKMEHKQQAMIYSVALNRPIVVYMYLNKNDSNIKDYPVQFESEIWNKLKTKTINLNKLFSEGTQVKGEVGYHCRDCPYVFSCPDYASSQLQRK